MVLLLALGFCAAVQLENYKFIDAIGGFPSAVLLNDSNEVSSDKESCFSRGYDELYIFYNICPSDTINYIGKENHLFLSKISNSATVVNGQESGCPEQYGVQTYPHPEACDHYFLCVNGTLSLERCGNGLLYDGKGAVHEHCNYHWGVDCGQRKADLAPISSNGCEFQFGLYPATDSCSTQYVKCAHGVPHLEPCDVGLVYDERIHGCNWPDKLLEKCNPEGVIGFKCPESVDPHSIQAKYWPYPRFAVPGAPDRLITCVDGHPRINTCGDGKLFDESSLSCVEPNELAK